MAISKEEIKSIAVTSAIAGAGAAMASAMVGYILEHYVFQREAAGPTFVVVPVQQPAQPAETPVFAGYGAVSVAGAARAATPRCHSYSFNECLDDDNRYKPECVRYESIHQLYDEDEDAWDKLIDDIPFCEHTRGELLLAGVAGVAGGFLLMMLVQR